MTVGSAPGKVILLGEHAVVYGRPAIAAPIVQVQALAEVVDAPVGSGLTIVAADLGREFQPRELPSGDRDALSLAHTVRNTLERLGRPAEIDLRVTISSTVPVGSGLGSGAAVATALVRALATHLGTELAAPDVSDLVYQTEILHHGTPSGIDNTVIAYGRPIYFVRGRPIETFAPRRPFWLVIADTGIRTSTREVVGDVRRHWETSHSAYEAHFCAIGAIVQGARQAIEAGNLPDLGRLMDANQRHLRAINVSSSELESLVAASLGAGALGAKLCGSGRGGHMVALAEEGGRDAILQALLAAGARHAISTLVS